MCQRRPWHLHGFLDLARRHFAAGTYQEEKHLQTGEMGEGLEGLDVQIGRLEAWHWERCSLYHISIYI